MYIYVHSYRVGGNLELLIGAIQEHNVVLSFFGRSFAVKCSLD